MFLELRKLWSEWSQDINNYSHDEQLLLKYFNFYEELRETKRHLGLFSFVLCFYM